MAGALIVERGVQPSEDLLEVVVRKDLIEQQLKHHQHQPLVQCFVLEQLEERYQSGLHRVTADHFLQIFGLVRKDIATSKF